MWPVSRDLGACNSDPSRLVAKINNLTALYNKDNISRTAAYFSFFQLYPEIKWAFLASMVSRNAGWNMCDLEGATLPKVLSLSYRRSLFMTYEVANFLIFRDAFPQLLLYHYSTKVNRSLFHFLPSFSVSSFMAEEWGAFLKGRDEERLVTALIINEQNVIQKPVIEGVDLQENVFRSSLFAVQDRLHFSTVIFPTERGELYGATVAGFRNVSSRIELGKQLASILFHSEQFPLFFQFAKSTEHTGSRWDYEQYYPYRKQRETPYLRSIYPVIRHELAHRECWDRYTPIKKKWRKPAPLPDCINMTHQYEQKQRNIRLLSAIKNFFVPF